MTNLRDTSIQANADKKVQAVLDRKRLLRQYKDNRKKQRQYEQKEFMVRRSSELIQRMKRNQEHVWKQDSEILAKRVRELENVIQERKTRWILNPEDIKEDDFITYLATNVPTGWWGNAEPSTINRSEFDFDNFDRENYFTTVRNRFTRFPEIYTDQSIVRTNSQDIPSLDVENIT